MVDKHYASNLVLNSESSCSNLDCNSTNFLLLLYRKYTSKIMHVNLLSRTNKYISSHHPTIGLYTTSNTMKHGRSLQLPSLPSLSTFKSTKQGKKKSNSANKITSFVNRISLQRNVRFKMIQFFLCIFKLSFVFIIADNAF